MENREDNYSNVFFLQACWGSRVGRLLLRRKGTFFIFFYSERGPEKKINSMFGGLFKKVPEKKYKTAIFRIVLFNGVLLVTQILTSTTRMLVLCFYAISSYLDRMLASDHLCPSIVFTRFQPLRYIQEL